MGSLLRLEPSIRELMLQATAAKTFPGGVVGVLRGDDSLMVPVGRQTYTHDSAPITSDSIYDVASITKSVPTSFLALQLIDEGKLGLDDVVTKFVPEFVSPGAKEATIRHLLTYTLIFDIPGGSAALALAQRENFLRWLMQAPLKHRPGKSYFYTNPPAILLGMVIERMYGKPLDEIASSQLFEPLGMTGTGFAPPITEGRVVPSERSSDGDVIGAPNDEAARMMRLNGQIAGCAGLFSTVPDLLKFARMILNEGISGDKRYISATLIEQMATNQLAELGAQSGLGWEIGRPDVLGAAHDGIMLKSGFTGCVIIIDPARQMALVHLSNRTYPMRPDREPIRAYWRGISELVLLEP